MVNLHAEPGACSEGTASITLADHVEPFAAVIRCTADPAKVDKRTRSKWSRALRYALEYKLPSEPLDAFIKRKGGINRCAERFSRTRARKNISALIP